MLRRTRTLPALAIAAAALAVALAAAPRASGLVMVTAPTPRWDPRAEGPVVQRDDAPPPISGGTLLVLGDGARVVVADPERDRVQLVALAHDAPNPVLRTIALGEGAEPGRAVQDEAGRVHVVLRGAGELLTFHPDRETTPRRVEVCAMPRGVAAQGDRVHVACRGGRLVTLDADSGRRRRTARLPSDLRDAVVLGDDLYVSQFRHAALHRVGDEGDVELTRRPSRVSEDGDPFVARVAWRTRPFGARALMIHHRANESEVRPGRGGYGGERITSRCHGVVKSAISIVGAGRPRPGPSLAQAPLPVDFAVRADADGDVRELAIVAAANQGERGGVLVYDRPRLDRHACLVGQAPPFGGHDVTNAVAVAYAGERLIVQRRDPASLVIAVPDVASARTVSLGGESTFDTGHAIFHAGTAAELACASCHPEGGDDGHTWRFTGLGPRRTLSLHSAAGTAPFHWSGEIDDIRRLMDVVFVSRMNGVRVDAPHANAVEAWLGQLQPPHLDPRDPSAVARGEAIFRGAGGCDRCHAGPRFTNGRNVDIGTGGNFQVPSLVGVSHRLPVMHDGCATTLRRRFDRRCGGSRHNPALRRNQIDDLVAFLESI